ncbi:hypothetical protein GCE86_09030 [Micromonospora terminaliae]|uniref:Uncharacterized protein n=1 Tax=Micromonospora terminaliae TaxID=1914461 RepID=A0AAJ2ZDN8_9ACTN|nr:hypothetical protein [Micromonospora terminaliae]NES28072.1 hypothetical protein [Micromonospora terminaliae]QGL47176.1 hypothetical protein GCE86_09030 [Micromonospora terminaliae]
MAIARDTSGRVVTVRDMLDGISTSLKYTNYQLDTAGVGHEPHPWNWTECAGHFRSVVTKEAELAEHVARTIDRWVKANPNADAANLAAMRAASKDLKAAARSLINLGKKMRNVQSCLDVTQS